MQTECSPDLTTLSEITTTHDQEMDMESDNSPSRVALSCRGMLLLTTNYYSILNIDFYDVIQQEKLQLWLLRWFWWPWLWFA